VSDYDGYDDFSDLADDDFNSPAPPPYQLGDAEQLLVRLRDVVENAPNVPLSSTPRVSREEVLDLLEEAIERLPEELRQARWLLKEREEFLDKVRHEGEDIIATARDRAERMVQRTEVVKAAEARAYQILDNAEIEARRLRHEVEDFCDQKLGSFEIVLERTMKLVSSGRAKLQGTALVEAPGPDDETFDMATGEHAAIAGVAAPLPSRAHADDAVEDGTGYEGLPPPPGA